MSSMDWVDPMTRPATASPNEALGAPSSASEIARLRYRMEQLERRLALVGRSGDPRIEHARWGTEIPTVSTSPPHRVVFGGWLYEFAIDLRVAAGSGSTTVDLYRNGSMLGTATIAAAGTQSIPVTIAGVRCAPGDQLWVDATAVGAGALGLGAYAKMSA